MVNGDGPSPALVYRLVQALPDTSLTHALMLGGREHYGWGMDRHLSASIFDAIQNNTVGTGSWKKGKAPKVVPWPRPKARTVKKKKSLAEVRAALMQRKASPS